MNVRYRQTDGQTDVIAIAYRYTRLAWDALRGDKWESQSISSYVGDENVSSVQSFGHAMYKYDEWSAEWMMVLPVLFTGIVLRAGWQRRVGEGYYNSLPKGVIGIYSVEIAVANWTVHE